LKLPPSLRFNSHFPGEPGLANFIEAKDGRSGDDNWSYNTCKTPVESSPPTNQHGTFYMPDALPVAKPTVSKHWRENDIEILMGTIQQLSVFSV